MAKKIVLILSALTLVLMAGCAKPPEADIQAAQAAITDAQNVKASTYAPDALAEAQRAVDAANAAKQEQDSKFALFRNYDKVQQAYVAAKQAAETAKANAIQEEERQKQEIANLLTQAQLVVDKAVADIAVAPVGKGNKADIEVIKAEVTNLQPMIDDARNDFNGANYQSAKAKLESLVTKANGIIAEIVTAAEKAGPVKKGR